MFEPSPTSVSPRQGRGVALAPLPSFDFLVSTKLPTCASSQISLSGLRCANGPIFAPSPTVLSVRTQLCLTSTLLPSVQFSITVYDRMRHFAPIRVLPNIEF